MMQTQELRVQSSCPLILDELLTVGLKQELISVLIGANSIATGMKLVGIEAG